MLTLGWSNGYSFIPLDFTMFSSASDSNRLANVDNKIDKRTRDFKRRKEAVEAKPKCASDMIDLILDSGLVDDSILMDSWFTNEPMLKSLLSKGLDVIGMRSL